MPGGLRRPHRKSRSGCLECKRRRVKCDEARPACSLCIRFGISCEYASGIQKLHVTEYAAPTVASPPVIASLRTRRANLRSGGEPTQASPPFSSPSLSTANPDASPAQNGSGSLRLSFSIEDLTLFHRWVTITCYATVLSQAGGAIWQNGMTEIGLRYPFVLYGMLSLAALHHAYLDPPGKSTHIVTAAEYHNRAITGLSEALNRLNNQCSTGLINDDEEKIALHISTVVNVLYFFAMYGPTLESKNEAVEQRSERISRTLGKDWIPIMRGVHLTLRPSSDAVRNSPLRAMLQLPDWDTFDVPAEAFNPEDEQILNLRETWRNAGDSDAKIYEETQHLLRRCYAWVARFRDNPALREEGYNHEWSSPFMWIHISPERFFVLLQQRQPAALIMFAYFGGLLHQLDHYWWMRGWGRSVVAAIDELLADVWQPWMVWPKSAVQFTSS